MRNKVNAECSVVIREVIDRHVKDQRKGVEIGTVISRNNASAWKALEGD